MNIAFIINRLGLTGLGATLCSLIRNCSKTADLKLYFFCSKITARDKKNIVMLLSEESYEGAHYFVDFDAAKQFRHLASLHGDHTIYGKFLIPKAIPNEKVLYLDSDLIVNLDVNQLRNFKMNHFLAAVKGSALKYILEGPFFIEKLKWEPDELYFNAGILLLDTGAWNKKDISAQAEQLMAAYTKDLRSHDQTLLNMICRGAHDCLPDNFNVPWLASYSKPAYTREAIIHFVGSPKPWDIGGKLIHKGYHFWRPYINTNWHQNYTQINLAVLRRTWNIRRSLARNVMKKFK